MSTILQPCLESQFIETAKVKLKFPPPKSLELSRSLPSHQSATKHVGGNTAAKTDLCGLSFHQVLANICSTPKETTEKETVYVHPLSKKSSFSRLTEKSFEMCTENLGSETGADIMDGSILSLSPSVNNSPREKSSSPREYSKNYKVNNSRNFPPPLTTISGSNPIQVRPHREDGRLVIRAIERPAIHNYLRAERSNGRLRLSLLKDDDASEFDLPVTAEENEIDVVEKDESYINGEDLDQENQEGDEYYHKNEEDDDEERDAQMSSSSKEDMEGNNFDIEVEMGMEKFQRLSRCNEGEHSNKVLYNWEPLWVATS